MYVEFKLYIVGQRGDISGHSVESRHSRSWRPLYNNQLHYKNIPYIHGYFVVSFFIL